MAEDSTPLLRESLDKCFIEQQLALKQLTVQYEDLEDKVELVDCFFTQLDGNQEENRRNLEKLEKKVTELEGRDYRLELLEERVAVLKVQNIELRDHINLTVDMLNNVTTILNSQFRNKEQTDETIQTEVTAPHEDMLKDTQPTVQQVFAVYQSQPPDGEGWDEMTAAINAAEEYEARKKS